jgi:predicted N-acyltransferase
MPLAEVRDLPAWREGLRPLPKDHRYYEIVADTLRFDCRALILENDEGDVLAVQPCFFVEQDLLAAALEPLRKIAATVRRIFPGFLRLRMLMAGCAAGEGHLAAAASDSRELIAQLNDGLQHFARQSGSRLVVWKDFPARYRSVLSVLGETHLASMPATRLALDFTSFDDYLTRRLSHAMRKNLRRKFKVLAAAPPLTMSVTNDLAESADEALALYEQVRARSPLQFEHLTKSFLQQLAARMPERVHFFLWRQEGRLVAFSLCLVHDGVLYDEYLGLDYRVALDLHLYFVTFRDVLTWALAQGLTAYHSTPLNYEPKLHLGFDLMPLDLYVALPWPCLSRLAHPFLSRMSPTRAEPVLARFANAREMAAGAPTEP